MQRHRGTWDHTSQEIESLPVTVPSTNDWLKEIAWQLAKLREDMKEQIVNTP